MFIVIVVAGVALLCCITYFRKLGYLWNECFTTIDHKKIGTMYTLVSLEMMFRGFVNAEMTSTKQALASGDRKDYLIHENFDHIFTAPGVLMSFFLAMHLIFALMNWVFHSQYG
ncbi:cytochrome o ubiquinol oxidase subunit I, partial [Francisella tularensis]|nr:cytochrome o ubiquinol oxidase subunit I [Francisella tularensis]